MIVVVGVETKALSSSRQWGLWGNAGNMSYRHQVYHAGVCGDMKDNRAGTPDIPEWYITKIEKEPT